MDIKKLIAVATGKIPHNYRSGLCPDELQPDSRDPDCPACKILTEAAAEHDEMDRRLREAESRVAELESERAEREKQEPIAWYCDGEDGREYNGCPQMSNGRTGIPLYATPPVTAPVRLTDSEAEAVARIHGTGGWQTLADMMKFSRAVETAVLRANGFDIQPARGGD